MLFEDIPIIFKNKIKEYLNKLFNTIKINGNYLSLNGRLAPKNIKTQHHKFIIGSEKHINLMIELYYLLYIFHEFSLTKNILYSITAGNLLGYYDGGDMLLWDDDIDILINDVNSFKIIMNLWNNGETSYDIWDKNWSYKNINIYSKNIILLKANNNFFKIKLNSNVGRKGSQKDIGGLDIINPHGIRQKIPKEIKDIVFNEKDENDEKYQITNYGPIQTRILKKEFAILLLNGFYGINNWNKKIHPSLH